MPAGFFQNRLVNRRSELFTNTGLWQDTQYGLRALAKNPGFTAAAVFALALGIGATTAVFTFADRLLFRPLPFLPSDRLVSIYHQTSGDSFLHPSLPYPDYLYYRDHNAVFTGLAAHTIADAELRVGARVETVSGEVVSANYFSILGVPLAAGRTFLPEEDSVPGRNPVVILGSGLWQQWLGSDPAVLGRQVILNHTNFTVVGIAPPGFAGLRLDRAAAPQFWIPAMMYPAVFGTEQDRRNYRGNEWLSLTGRLKHGQTIAAAQANFAELTGRLLQASPDRYESDRTCVLMPANLASIDPNHRVEVERMLAMLMAVAGVVLLLSCANVAGLLVARAVGRQKEVGVRLALGAGKRRIVQQLLTENLLLALLGGAAGLAVASAGTRLLAGFDHPFHVHLLLDTRLDLRTLAFALTASILSALMFGLIPLRHALQGEVLEALRADATPLGSRRFGARDALVIAQVALSVLLLAGSGLFLRTLRNAEATDVTRRPENVLLMDLNLAQRKYQEARGHRF